MKVLSAAEVVERATQPLARGVTVDLTGIEVHGALDLSAKTLGNVDFSDSVFHGAVSLKGAILPGLAWFRRCRFRNVADLAGAIFHNDLRAEGCQFAGPFSATRAEFCGVADFDRATFQALASLDRMTCYGNMSMDHTRFLGPATLQGSEFLGGLWCDSTRFEARTDFSGVEVHGRTWVRLAILGKEGHGRASALRQLASYGRRWL